MTEDRKVGVSEGSDDPAQARGRVFRPTPPKPPSGGGRRARVRHLDEYDGQPVSAICALRLRCLDCCGNQTAEVRECPAIECPAWQYRMGRFTPLSEEQRVKVAAHYERARQTGRRK